MDTSILEQEFNQKQIKQRRGPGGKMLDYVEHSSVIRRLNQAFDYNWSFDIEKFEQNDGQVVVLGKLTAEGIIKMQFGSKSIMKGKNGNLFSIGDDYKAAASDCLKKCATLFGVALHLYSDDVVASNSTGMSKMTMNKGNNKITKEQLIKMRELRTKLSWSLDELKDLVKSLHNTDNPLELNTVMGDNVIAVLEKKFKEKAEA